MSAITDVRDQFQSLVSRVIFHVRRTLFGMNNERIDFLMDSFYKLSPQQQTGLLSGVAGALLVFVLGAFTIYFSRINALEDELNSSFDALQEVRTLSANYETELKRYQELKGIVAKNSADFKPKPYFESQPTRSAFRFKIFAAKTLRFPATVRCRPTSVIRLSSSVCQKYPCPASLNLSRKLKKAIQV